MIRFNTIIDINNQDIRGERKLKSDNKNDEIIQFCLKHDLIKKTENGYVIKKNFFDLLDFYYGKGGENYNDII